MEINVTKNSLDLAKAVLHAQLKLCAELKKKIRIVEAQGAASPDGLKTTGKKAPTKAVATSKKAAPVAKTAKKATAKKVTEKKATEKTATEKTATEKTVYRTEDGKRIPLRTRVLDYVKKTYKSDEVWTPKMLLSMVLFKDTGNVHLSQVLKDLCGEGTGEKQINKISKGKYQTL